MSIEELKSEFKSLMDIFVNNCIMINKDHIKNDIYDYYFINQAGNVYGFDSRKQLFFEPTGDKKHTVVTEGIKLYFTDVEKQVFEEKTGLPFNTLEELILRKQYKEKHIGIKYFYSEKRNNIYIWKLLGNKWEEGDCNSLRYLFSNSDLMPEMLERVVTSKIIKVDNFEDLGIQMSDLIEIQTRYRDASIHFYHKVQQKIYSSDFSKTKWYILPQVTQDQILLEYLKNDQKN